jgi:hypothetical protein
MKVTIIGAGNMGLEHLADTGFAAREMRVDIRMAQQDGLRPERERLNYVGATADAAVHEHLNFLANGLHDLKGRFHQLGIRSGHLCPLYIA